MKSALYAMSLVALLLACSGSAAGLGILTPGTGISLTASLPLYLCQVGVASELQKATPSPVAEPQATTSRFRVYNANIKKKKGPTAAEYTTRVRKVAAMMAAKDNSRGRAANLFAVVEAYHTGSGWWTRHHEEERIPCGPRGELIWTHECLYNYWAPALSDELRVQEWGGVGGQYGDVSVLALNSGFALIPTSPFIKKKIGPGGWWRLQYKIIGVRLAVSGTNKILPFYSVHVVTKAGGEGRQKDSVRDIVRIAKDNYVGGDLTPLVVGDFNSSPGEAPYQIMLQDFAEVAGSCGSDIEHIWAGRRSSFPGTAGAPVFLSCELGQEFSDDAATMTDHNVPFAEFALPSGGDGGGGGHKCPSGTVCCGPLLPNGKCNDSCAKDQQHCP